MLQQLICPKDSVWLHTFSLRLVPYVPCLNVLVLGVIFAFKKPDGLPYEWQMELHNAYWPVKFLMMVGWMSIAFFLIPGAFYDYYAYVGMLVCRLTTVS